MKDLLYIWFTLYIEIVNGSSKENLGLFLISTRALRIEGPSRQESSDKQLFAAALVKPLSVVYKKWAFKWEYKWEIMWAFKWEYKWEIKWAFKWEYKWEIMWAFKWDYKWKIMWV